MNVLREALTEVCRVTTRFGTRSNLKLMDSDDNHALFEYKSEHCNDVVIIRIEDIHALEFENDNHKDGEHIRGEDS